MVHYIACYLAAHPNEKNTSLKFERIIKKNPYLNRKSQTDLTALYQMIGGKTPQTLDFIVDPDKLPHLKLGEYSVRIKWDDAEPFNPKDAVVDVRIETKTGEEHSADFITLNNLDYQFKKNKRAGECLGGTYFCMPGMIVIEEITDENISRTICDLVKNHEIEDYFRKV